MFSWSFKRQLLYLALPLVLVLGIFAYIFFTYLHVTPSCTDGVKNGDERGIDCGGSCTLLCKGEALSPIVRWSESFPVAGSVWNAGAYVENPNLDSEAVRATYTFSLYDENNKRITSVNGETIIPAGKKSLVFYPSIDTAGKVVKRTEFEFSPNIVWSTASGVDRDLVVTHGAIERETTSPLLSGTIENRDVVDSGVVEISAIIYDGRQNAIGISRTYVDNFSPREKQVFGFTWPERFKQTQVSCEVSSDVMLVLDRSGSMASISSTPPEPLSTVKNTAVFFVSSLTLGDQAGVVSFANEASNPIDQALSPLFTEVQRSIERIAIATTSTQNTNIGDGLYKATDELLSPRARADSKKVIILLTDGDPTDPKIPGQTNYPALFADQASQNAKDKGVSVFTVGLGSLVNDDLLARLASSPSQYFKAPTPADLSSIYQKISKSICVLRPNVIEIIAIPQNY